MTTSTPVPPGEDDTLTGRFDQFLTRLDEGPALDRAIVGGKAAALAELRRHGLSTLPGVVLTTEFCRQMDRGGGVPGNPAIEACWASFPDGQRLVARSSSVVEDAAESSQAGQFESVIGIDTEGELGDAVEAVLASRARAGASEHPIAVLVQPMVEPSVSGVLFGVDPVTGRSDRRVVSAVTGQPGALVSGEVDGARYVLDESGDVVHRDGADGPHLDPPLLGALADLARRVAQVFGGPQDVEWAVVDSQLVVLQSRAVTTPVRGVPRGPIYGPGPVAETFPEALSTLESDLWVPPLDAAVREALRLAAAGPERRLTGPDLVVVVGGRVAIDLERTGEVPPSGGGGGLGVLGRIRRLRSAWRVGRLRSALPALGLRLVDIVDDDLEELPPLGEVTDRQLVALLGRAQEALRSLHAHEVLMGLLGDETRSRLTGASVAMRVLGEARSEGRTDEEIIARSPVVLALTPPRVGGTPQLPARSTTPDLTPTIPTSRARPSNDVDPSVVREALRLRVRWVQELSARAAWELGDRLTREGTLERTDDVRWLSLADLVALVTKRAVVVADVVRSVVADGSAGPALPARFRVSDRGAAIPELDGVGEGGTGAGGGRGTGPVTHDAADPPVGSVLVITTLQPGIGPLLPRLAGLVSETGNVLAHLAILAREHDVPTVVGDVGAVGRFEEGTVVTVDGQTGEVTAEDADEPVGAVTEVER